MIKVTTILFAIAALYLTACQSAPSADNAATSDKQQEAQATGSSYLIDTSTSTVTWIGTKPTGQHTGTFNLSNGTLTLDGAGVTGGNFVINVASLNSTDQQGEYKTKLDGHLKSADFFDVEKFPTASFTITNVQPFDSSKVKSLLPGATHIISGNLKLKDSTKNITFPAKVDVQGDVVSTAANFNIDRTQWGMHYGNDASLQDKFIQPEVNIQLNIKAKK